MLRGTEFFIAQSYCYQQQQMKRIIYFSEGYRLSYPSPRNCIFSSCLKTPDISTVSYLCGSGDEPTSKREWQCKNTKTIPCWFCCFCYCHDRRERAIFPFLPALLSNYSSIISSNIDITLCCILMSLGSLLTLKKGTFNYNCFHTFRQ